MPSFTSSSEARFVAAFVLTFAVLATSWEVVLRNRSGATVDFAISRPALTATQSRGERWILLGNCLVMTGVSPRSLNEQLGDRRERIIINIASHEQSPIAFFEYLRSVGQYPDVIIANVSSWINGTNFEQESAQVIKMDPLGLGRPEAPVVPDNAAPSPEGFRRDGTLGGGIFQRRAEAELADQASKHLRFYGHRYHLFDYSLFLGTLVTRADLDDALYQLNMQSWFTVKGSETDGFGYVGVQVAYRDDWPTGFDRMGERSLQRLRVSRLLTPRYWSLLEEHVRAFQNHGTRVLFVRMPEHPKIRAFNEETYDVTGHLRGIEQRTGAPALDLSRLGVAEGVRLFDAVHPDAQAAEVITREVAAWVRAQPVTAGARAHGGGG